MRFHVSSFAWFAAVVLLPACGNLASDGGDLGGGSGCDDLAAVCSTCDPNDASQAGARASCLAVTNVGNAQACASELRLGVYDVCGSRHGGGSSGMTGTGGRGASSGVSVGVGSGGMTHGSTGTGAPACGPCPADPHGAATCEGGSCGVVCDAGFHACGGVCASNTSPATCGASCSPCPSDPNGVSGCDGSQCTTTCGAGALQCGGGCAACPSDAATTACRGGACVATSCAADLWLCATGCCGGFTSEVASADNKAQSVSVAIAHDGSMHASYASEQGAWVAANAGGSFALEFVAQNADPYAGTAVRFDSRGGRHVVYLSVSQQQIVDHAGTTDSVVANLGTTNISGVSLGAGTVGSTMHVAYGFEGSSNGIAFYAEHTSAGWGTSDTVATLPGIVVTPSICVDGANSPALVYQSGDTVYVKRGAPGSWGSGLGQVVGSSAAHASFYAACAFDAQDRLHLIHKDANSLPHYVRLDGNAAAVDEEVSFGGATCDSGDLALDDLGRPHVACASSAGVELAIRRTSWKVTPVDLAPVTAYRGVAIAVDAGAIPHLVYVAPSGLRHAHPG